MSSVLRAALAPFKQTRRVHLSDASSALGGFDGADNASLVSFHADAQALLASWCCTSVLAFRPTRGVVPYLLPPLEGQSRWRGHPQMRWVARALNDVYLE